MAQEVEIDVVERVLNNARKNISHIPCYDPTKEIWRSYRQRLENYLEMTGIAEMGRQNQPARCVTFAKHAVIAGMSGTAVERVRPFLPGSEAANRCTSLEQYLALLQELFQPPSESRSLKLEFKNRKQNKDEDVSSFLSSKYALYDIAYPPEQRDHETLLTEVIKGLFSIVVKRRLQMARDIDNREALRERLFEIVSKEREAYQQGFAESTSLDGLVAVAVPHLRRAGYGSHGQGHGADEPMEVDAMREEIARLHAQVEKGAGGGQGGQNPPKPGEKRTCFNCNKTGHLKRDCPVPLKGDGKGKGGKKTKKHCVHCGRKGHTVEVCRQRIADKATAKKAIKVLDEDEEQDSDEEVGFLGVTRGAEWRH